MEAPLNTTRRAGGLMAGFSIGRLVVGQRIIPVGRRRGGGSLADRQSLPDSWGYTPSWELSPEPPML